METLIKPNLSFSLRVIFLIIFAAIFICCVNAFRKVEEAHYALVFTLILFPLCLSELVKGIFFVPASLTISYDTLYIHYWLSGDQTIAPTDISGYSITAFKTKVKDYEGIIIYLKNGKPVELSKYNLKTIKPVIQYFSEKKDIPFLGNERSHISVISGKYAYISIAKDKQNGSSV